MLLYLIKLEQHFMIIRFTKHIAELQGLRKHIARVANEKSVSFCLCFIMFQMMIYDVHYPNVIAYIGVDRWIFS